MSLSKPVRTEEKIGDRESKPNETSPIPLIRPSKEPLDKGQYMSFKLKLEPTKTTSATYNLAVPFFQDGTPEELMQLVQSLEQVYHRSRMTRNKDKVGTLLQLLKG